MRNMYGTHTLWPEHDANVLALYLHFVHSGFLWLFSIAVFRSFSLCVSPSLSLSLILVFVVFLFYFFFVFGTSLAAAAALTQHIRIHTNANVYLYADIVHKNKFII